MNCACFEDLDNNGYEDDRFVLTSENIKDLMASVAQKSVKSVYKASSNISPRYWNNDRYGYYGQTVNIPSELLRVNGYSWNGGADSIKKHIEDGVFFAIHHGHGQPTYWSDPYFSTYNISALNNGKKLPVVFDMDCLTGKYDGQTCFAEAFLRKENGGCVAIFANSSNSFSGFDDALVLGMFCDIWPSNGFFNSFPYGNSIILIPHQSYRLGYIMDIGLFNIPNFYDGSFFKGLKHTKEIFHCFGDPAMEIYTAVPTHFENVVFHKYNGTVYLTLQENAKITFSNTSSGSVDSFYGTSVSYPDATDLCICVSAHNKIPLIIDNGTLYLQNEEIANNVNYEADKIKAGTNVTLAKSTGDIIITGANVTLKGNTVELHDNTTISKESCVEIKN